MKHATSSRTVTIRTHDNDLNASTRISVELCDGVLLLTLLDRVGHGLVDVLDHVLTEAQSSSVVLDLSHCSVVDPAALTSLDPSRWGRDREHFAVVLPGDVDDEQRGRVATCRFAVHETTEDALSSDA